MRIFGKIVGLSLLLAAFTVSAWAGCGVTYTADANTVALFNLDGNVNDASANGYNGVLQGTNSWNADDLVAGGAGHALGGFTANVVGVQDDGNGFKIEGWFNPSALPGDADYMLGAGGGHLFYSRVLGDGSVSYGIEMPGALGWVSGSTAAGTMAVGQWTHLAFVTQNGNTNFYVNDTLKGTLVGATMTLTALDIGEVPWATTWAPNAFQGQIDAVRIERFQAVPEPGSLLALGTALIGFLGAYRRKLS